MMVPILLHKYESPHLVFFRELVILSYLHGELDKPKPWYENCVIEFRIICVYHRYPEMLKYSIAIKYAAEL